MRTILVLFLTSLVGLLLPPSFQAQGVRLDLTFKEDTFSADLEEAPLKDIAKKFKAEKGILFRGKQSLLDEKVSLQFKDLPIQDGLERILSAMNYSLLFDQNADLVGVILVGKSGGERSVETPQRVAPRRTLPRRTVPRRVIPPRPR